VPKVITIEQSLELMVKAFSENIIDEFERRFKETYIDKQTDPKNKDSLQGWFKCAVLNIICRWDLNISKSRRIATEKRYGCYHP
jgi:hypothetical protein